MALPADTDGYRLAAVAIALGLYAAALGWLSMGTGVLPASDREQYELIAFNLARHGEFHVSRTLAADLADGPLQPYSRRSPGYPLYLAAVFASSAEFRALNQTCISDPACEAADPLRNRVRGLTVALIGATVALAFVTTLALAGNWTVSIATGLLCLLLVPTMTSDIPNVLAGFWLLLHASLAALNWRKPRAALGVPSGLALGALMLTKEVFQYWLVGFAFLLAAAAWLDAGRRRALVAACLAPVLAAAALTLPWMIRNAMVVGHFGISGRDGENVAIRAEYGRMTWAEVRGGFAYYLPDFAVVAGARDVAMRWLEPENFGYTRFDRENPEGFYRRAKDDTGETAARASLIDPGWRDSQVATDAALRRASAELMRADWRKHVALTLVFLERAALSIGGNCKNAATAAAERAGPAMRMPVRATCALGTVSTPLFLPLACVLLLLAWRRRTYALLLLVSPVAYGFGIHAAATHFIPRYARPLLPLLVVVAAVAAHESWRCIVERRRREPSPRPAAQPG